MVLAEPWPDGQQFFFLEPTFGTPARARGVNATRPRRPMQANASQSSGALVLWRGSPGRFAFKSTAFKSIFLMASGGLGCVVEAWVV